MFPTVLQEMDDKKIRNGNASPALYIVTMRSSQAKTICEKYYEFGVYSQYVIRYRLNVCLHRMLSDRKYGPLPHFYRDPSSDDGIFISGYWCNFS